MQDFRIDSMYQNRGYGYKGLKLLIDEMRYKNSKLLTTTYTYGNEQAEKLYKKIGFVETDIVNENGIHEVNMRLIL